MEYRWDYCGIYSRINGHPTAIVFIDAVCDMIMVENLNHNTYSSSLGREKRKKIMKC